jgi:hypothetical protein
MFQQLKSVFRDAREVLTGEAYVLFPRCNECTDTLLCDYWIRGLERLEITSFANDVFNVFRDSEVGIVSVAAFDDMLH